MRKAKWYMAAASAALAMWAGVGLAQESTVAVDRSTTCGAPARGLKGDGSGDVVTLDAQGARNLRVDGDGVWRPCEPTPNRACGQGGTGYMDARGIVDLLPEEARGWKTDGGGRWVECQACAPAQPGSTRDWSVGVHRCTTALAYGSDRGRDRTIAHGDVDAWSQWTGPMRGFLIEACFDGQRTVRASSCEPAAGCDTRVDFDREIGGVYHAFTFDARGDGRMVPNGTTVEARSPGGAVWPVSCVAGSWEAPATLPVATTTPVAAKRPSGCGRQTFSARVGLATTYWRYAGARVAVGEVVAVALVNGTDQRQAVCLKSERFELR